MDKAKKEEGEAIRFAFFLIKTLANSEDLFRFEIK